MEKVLVTGAAGQLGIDLCKGLTKDYTVIGLDKSQLDITHLDQVLATVKKMKPNIIINSAAYTNVDQAETNVDFAYQVNAIGARNLAIASLEQGSRLVQISTDFVFDGYKEGAYIEFDDTNPINIYGESKLAGEKLVREATSRHYILRTSWLYGKYGNNFVKTMIRLAESNKTLEVVNDQRGTPTYTLDLVELVKMLIKTDAYGTYHASNEGECNWYEFAQKIFELTQHNDIRVVPITSEKLNRMALRPKNSVMRNYALELSFDYHFGYWEDSLERYLSSI